MDISNRGINPGSVGAMGCYKAPLWALKAPEPPSKFAPSLRHHTVSWGIAECRVFRGGAAAVKSQCTIHCQVRAQRQKDRRWDGCLGSIGAARRSASRSAGSVRQLATRNGPGRTHQKAPGGGPEPPLRALPFLAGNDG